MPGRRRSVHLSDQQHDALENAMAARPSQEALHLRNVSDNSVAPSIQARARKLRRSIISDTLNQALYDRAEADNLVQNSILPGGPIADRLAGVQRKLQHSMTTDKVGHLLEQRKYDYEDLVQHNIARDTVVAPSLQQAHKALTQQLKRSNLYHAMMSRPSIVELVQRGVYVPESEEMLQDIIDDYVVEGSDQGDYDDNYEGDAYEGEYTEDDDYDQQYAEARASPNEEMGYQTRSNAISRSTAFQLTRLLLKTISAMFREGELSAEDKGDLKDLVVDQDEVVLSIAEAYTQDQDLNELKESLLSMLSEP